jgi:hypothetical protein
VLATWRTGQGIAAAAGEMGFRSRNPDRESVANTCRRGFRPAHRIPAALGPLPGVMKDDIAAHGERLLICFPAKNVQPHGVFH